jgi:hypothetical protein
MDNRPVNAYRHGGNWAIDGCAMYALEKFRREEPDASSGDMSLPPSCMETSDLESRRRYRVSRIHGRTRYRIFTQYPYISLLKEETTIPVIYRAERLNGIDDQ